MYSTGTYVYSARKLGKQWRLFIPREPAFGSWPWGPEPLKLSVPLVVGTSLPPRSGATLDLLRAVHGAYVRTILNYGDSIIMHREPCATTGTSRRVTACPGISKTPCLLQVALPDRLAKYSVFVNFQPLPTLADQRQC